MSGVVNQDLRQKQRNLSDRITELETRLTQMEQGLMRLTIGLHQKFQQEGPELASLKEQVSALVELGGIEEIERIINERRIERAREQSEAEKKSLDEGISDGYVIRVEKVEEKSLVIGRYFDKDGKLVPPGRAQHVIPGVQPQFKEKLLGATDGLMIALPDGGQFELLEIYNIDEVKASQVMAAKQAAAEAAAAQAAEVAKADEKADEAPEAPAEPKTTSEEE